MATVLFVHQTTSSYALAGAAAGVVALSDAATMPAQGWLVDRFGPARVLVPAAVVHLLGTVALLVAASNGSASGLLVAAGLAGIGNPPVSGSMRAVWPRLVEEASLPAAFTIESLVQQIVFMVGPLTVALTVAVASPAVALAAAAAMVCAGTVWFVVAIPTPVGPKMQERSGVLRGAGVRVLVGGTFLQSIAFGAVPTCLVAFSSAAGAPGFAGPLQAALTIGGIVGSLLPAGVADKQRYVRVTLRFAAVLVPVVAAGGWSSTGGLMSMAALLLTAGLFITPVAATSYVLLLEVTQPASRTEAFAWLSTGQAAGTAAGAAIAGLLADHAGVLYALALLPLSAALAAAFIHLVWTGAGGASSV